MAKHNLKNRPKNVQNVFQLETLENAWVFEYPGTTMIKISQHIIYMTWKTPVAGNN